MQKEKVCSNEQLFTPSYTRAYRKLIPFICIELTEKQMAQIQEIKEAYQSAPIAPPSNHIALKTAKVIIPETFDDFVILLQIYANLNYV